MIARSSVLTRLCAIVVAVATFHLAMLVPALGLLLILAIWALRSATSGLGLKRAFVLGTGVALAWYAPHLWWFTNIFTAAAFPLWLLIACWVGLWCVSMEWGRKRVLPWWALVLLGAFAWSGLEHFRCEVWSLRFTWLGLGWVWAPAQLLPWLGVYGSSFLLVAAALFLSEIGNKYHLRRPLWVWVIVIGGFAVLASLPRPAVDPGKGNGLHSNHGPRLVGVQVESHNPEAVRTLIQQTVQEHGAPDIFVLPEYTFPAGIPIWLPDLARDFDMHIICGVIERRQSTSYNTAVVIDPSGSVVFRQVKSQPIQFFNDGEPAEERAVWQSPWGAIGIVICYDLSYTWVLDDVVKQGAEFLIVPTMDAEHWGGYQHRLHARVAPLRALEYQLPIFRLASSGISQAVNHHGELLASAPFPGQGVVMENVPAFHHAQVPALRWLWAWGLVPFSLFFFVFRQQKAPAQTEQGLELPDENARVD